MVRITNNYLINNTLSNIMKNQEKMSVLENQISSGKRFQTPSDDPIGTIFSMKTNARVNEIDQYVENLEHATSWIENSEASLDSVSEILTRTKELAVRGSTSTLTQDDRDKIASELNVLLEHLINLTNTDMAGDYLFAGNNIQNTPFEVTVGRPPNIQDRTVSDMILSVNYNGDTGELKRDEATRTKITINENGESAFMNISRQTIYSTEVFADAKAPLADNLRDGYITISGRSGDEIIEIDSDDSLSEITNKINSQSNLVSARMMPATGGYRLKLETREEGKNNQVSISAGGPDGIHRKETNLLEILGTTSEVTSSLAQSSFNDRIIEIDDSITSGYFFINNNLIKIDSQKETLSDVVRKINDMKQDFSASIGLDGKLTISGTGNLELKDGTSNFTSKISFPTYRVQAKNYVSDTATESITLEENEWIKNGNFFINGDSLGILDVTSETLYDLVDRVNAASAGVTARIADIATDGYDDRLIFESSIPGQAISQFKDGTSQFVKSFEFSYKSETLSIDPYADSLLANGISGKISVNNTEFEIYPSDSYNTVAQRISDSPIGIRASIEEDPITPGQYRFVMEPKGVNDGFDTDDFMDVGVASNFLSSMNFASRIESSFVATSPHIDRSLADDINTNITSGWVVIDGQEFYVDAANDQLKDIVEKINASPLDVSASINANNELILDSRHELTIFDASVIESKDLRTLNLPGGVDPQITPLNAIVPPLTGGDITINGTALTVNMAGNVDNLLNDINTNIPGVKAWFDPADYTIKMRNEAGTEDIVVTPFTGAAGESDVLNFFGIDDQANKSQTNLFSSLGMESEEIVDRRGNTSITRAASSAKSIFDVMIEFRDNLLNSDLKGMAEDEEDPFGAGVLNLSSLHLIDMAISNNADVMTRIGGKINRIDLTLSRHREIKIYTEKLIANNEDINIEEAIIDFNTLQNNYTASLQVGARVIQQTLLDFLR